MRVKGQIIVAVGGEAVMVLAGFLHGVHVHHSLLQITYLVQEEVVNLSGDPVTFANR